jgi:hypothetical protein
VEFAPMPLLLAYFLLLAAFVFQMLYLLRVQETVTPQPGVLKTLKPALLVPQRARSTLMLVLPADIAAWALGGFFLSLAPSLLAAATGSKSVLNGGSGGGSADHQRRDLDHESAAQGACSWRCWWAAVSLRLACQWCCWR